MLESVYLFSIEFCLFTHGSHFDRTLETLESRSCHLKIWPRFYVWWCCQEQLLYEFNTTQKRWKKLVALLDHQSFVRAIIRPVGTKDRWDPPFLPHLTIGFVSLLTQRVQFPRHLNLRSDLGLATVIFPVVKPVAYKYSVRHWRNVSIPSRKSNTQGDAMGSVCDEFPMEDSDGTLEWQSIRAYISCWKCVGDWKQNYYYGPVSWNCTLRRHSNMSVVCVFTKLLQLEYLIEWMCINTRR